MENSKIIDKWLNKKVVFVSTCHLTGEKGIIIEINFNSKDPKAFFGYDIKTLLDNGKTVTSYKFEGINLLNNEE